MAVRRLCGMRLVSAILASTMLWVGCSSGDPSGTSKDRDPAATEGTSSQSPSPVEAAYENPTIGMDVVYQIPQMHKARVDRDITYAKDLKMDVYHPRAWNGRDALPAVMIGGPPDLSAGKDSGQKVGWSQLVAASGFAAVAFDHRSDARLATPEKPARDVAAAIDFVRSQGQRLGIDGDRICTLGFSVGTAPWHLWGALREKQPYIKCNAVYYGPTDFRGFSGAPDLEIYSALSYLETWGDDFPPIFIAKAGGDTDDINGAIDRFVTAAETEEVDLQLEVYPDGPHGFDITEADTTSVEIMKATLRFFDEHLDRS